jgi:hypothetical protein
MVGPSRASPPRGADAFTQLPKPAGHYLEWLM